MKMFAIILLFVAIGCYTSGASDIANNVYEKTNENGTISFRIIKTYRGKEEVMMEIFRPNAQGVLTICSRSYLAGGDLVMTESDEHKSGRFDTITIYRPGTDAMEVFTRQADGSVKPVSTHLLSAYKEDEATEKDFFRTLNNTNTTEAQWDAKVQETKQKAQEIEKKIQDIQKKEAAGGQ